MKEIKAYIRRVHVNNVVEALRKAGAPGITIVEVHPVGYGYEPKYFMPPFGEVFKTSGPLEIVKLEVVCADSDVEQFVQVVQEGGHTGAKGDGIIFVSEVSRAIRIRDGASGEEVLARSI
jgi:nitrogen regulatory protein PII